MMNFERNLYRGKRVDNGEWVEGYLILKGNQTFISSFPYFVGKVHETSWLEFCFGGFIEVIPETVGQYTGSPDKNGKKIFEGNIVSIYTPCNEKHNIGVIRFGYYESGIPAIFKTNLGFYIEWASEDNINRIDFGFWIQAYQDETEVIGNVRDNPELLEVGE